MNQDDFPKYTVLTSEILFDDRVNDRQKILVSVINLLSKKNGYCFATNQYLSECMRVIPRTIQKDIQHLEEIGYLGRVVQVDKSGEVIARFLTVNDHPPVSTNTTPPVSINTTPPVSTNTYNNTSIYNNILVENEPDTLFKEIPNEISKRTDEKKIDKEIIAFTKHLLKTYFKDVRATGSLKRSIDTIDKLKRLDDLSLSQIEAIVKWAREDNFWKSNFLSLNKLRAKDKNGAKYWELFADKIKTNKQDKLQKARKHGGGMIL